MSTVETPANTQAPAETYTKEQLEHIVKERLARDREARVNENASKTAEIEQKLASAKAELQTASQTIETLKGTSATAEQVTAKIKASWEKIEASIPADKKKFIPAKYSEAEKIEYLAENQELFFPTVSIVDKPVTPAPVGANQSGGNPNLNGHANIVEFAQRDPKGFAKAKLEGKI